MTNLVGIDISKATFDFAIAKNAGWHQSAFSNNQAGFKQLACLLPPDAHLVMEASGPYYMPFANWFYNKGYKVTVCNPLSVKRYSQMMLMRAKTDKKDALTIAQWAAVQPKLKSWAPPTTANHQLRQMHTAMELLVKQIGQSKGQLEAFKATGQSSGLLNKIMGQTLKQLQKQKDKLEAQINRVAQQSYGPLLQRIQTIPGVGPKTATLLIACTDGFDKFDHYKKLIAYVGFSPKIKQSGTSVRGKGHICKMGKAQIRKLLYMCSWTAKKCNGACQKMYDRLKAKGKPERVIKIAIANKLLKQIFAIAKSGENYCPNYQQNTCF